MNVADIEGASPSVAPDKERNIKRGKTYLEGELVNNRKMDMLGHY